MSDRCDATRGPCACGAWHAPFERDRTVRKLDTLETEILDLRRALRSGLERAVLIGIARGRKLQRELDRIELEELGGEIDLSDNALDALILKIATGGL